MKLKKGKRKIKDFTEKMISQGRILKGERSGPAVGQLFTNKKSPLILRRLFYVCRAVTFTFRLKS